MKSKEEGFTLLEIIATLVLLGILAGAASTKYFDLTGRAEAKAAATAAAEIQVRINSRYSLALYSGNKCDEAVSKVNELAKIADSTEGKKARIGAFYFTGDTLTEKGTKVTAVSIASGETYKDIATVYVPTCLGMDEETEEDSSTSSGGSSSSGSDSGSSSSSGSSESECSGDDCTSSGDSGTTDGTDSGTTDSGTTGGSDNTESGSSSSGSSGSGIAASLPNPAVWPSVASECLDAGLLIRSGSSYYAVTSAAAFADSEKAGSIEDSAAFLSGNLIKLNTSAFVQKTTSGWDPALTQGSCAKDPSTNACWAFIGSTGSDDTEEPWNVQSTWWVKLLGS